MIRCVTLDDILYLHQRVLEQSGGAAGVRDRGALESAVAQPMMTFAGQELYPTLADKAAALGFSLVCNHPFVDGNKRVGHAAVELILRRNGHELSAPVAEQESLILRLAAGGMGREEFTRWVRDHMIERATE
jgi:death on curing protein